MGTSDEPAANRYRLLDAVRGVAASAVMTFHFVGYFGLSGVPTESPLTAAAVAAAGYGYLGVPVFFVLSGLVIAMTADRVAMTPARAGRYLARRFTRLTPPYWFMVAVHVGTVVAGRLVGLGGSTDVSFPQTAAHLVYLQDLLGYPALNPVFWTLALEVQFYLVFVGAAIVARVIHGARETTGRVIVVAGLWAMSVGLVVAEIRTPGLFPDTWYQFATGCLVYWGLTRTARGGGVRTGLRIRRPGRVGDR